ncbi:MAG TPA: hypothetical protein VJ793_09090 [Anaerolineae bacterium]|jgi:hypothetical protein|nr:hypothetical protein [Anaerolineae bacterium]
MTFDQLEGVAAETLASMSVALPVDAFQVAVLFGLDLVMVSRSDEGFDGHCVRVNGRAPARAQQEYVAMCLARAKLEEDGYVLDAHSVTRLARAIMLPRIRFIRDLVEGCDLAQLRQRHPHASTAMIGARVADLYVGTHALNA